MRLDKWLWCARLFKTRSLAADAIDAGRVLVDGERVKPAKTVRPGNQLRVRKPPYEFELAVLALADRRGPAPEAALLYSESAESRAERDKLAAELRGMPPPLFKGRPTKRDRRRWEALQAPQDVSE